MTSFPDYLVDLLKAARISQRQLSINLGHSAPYINRVVRGNDLPPLDDVERWAKFLKLRGDKRREFIVRVLAEHLGENVRKVVEDLWREHLRRARRR